MSIRQRKDNLTKMCNSIWQWHRKKNKNTDIKLLSLHLLPPRLRQQDVTVTVLTVSPSFVVFL